MATIDASDRKVLARKIKIPRSDFRESIKTSIVPRTRTAGKWRFL